MALDRYRRRILLVLVIVLLLAGLVLTWRLSSGRDQGSQRIIEVADPKDLDEPVKKRCEGIDYSDPAQGSLAFSDEFNQGPIDRTKWNVRDQDRLGHDYARLLAGNVGIYRGSLYLTAKREQSKDRNYTSGYVDTEGLFSQEYGRWEIRAKLPLKPNASAGMWPAFWLRPDNAPGELDILEAWGTPANPDRTFPGTYLYGIHNDTHNSQKYIVGWGKKTGRLDTDFHVFAVDRSQDCLRFSVDGRTVGIVDVLKEPWVNQSLAGPMNIRLNLQVGSDYWSPVVDDKVELPAHFIIDYVRVYGPATN